MDTDHSAAQADTAVCRPVAWEEVVGDDEPIRADVVVLDCQAPGSDADVVERMHRLTHRVLGVLQAWLSQERFGSATLLVVTRGAVAAADEGVSDPAGSAVWGLVGSAQTEDPGRVVMGM